MYRKLARVIEDGLRSWSSMNLIMGLLHLISELEDCRIKIVWVRHTFRYSHSYVADIWTSPDCATTPFLDCTRCIWVERRSFPRCCRWYLEVRLGTKYVLHRLTKKRLQPDAHTLCRALGIVQGGWR